MKKILIVVLSAIASLGVAFGASVVASADEVFITSLNDLKGKELVWNDTLTGSAEFTLTLDFESNGTTATAISYNSENGRMQYVGIAQVYNDMWEENAYKTILIDSETSITFNNAAIDITMTEEEFITWLNSNIEELNEPAPAENPTMWQAILTGIGGFLSGMFALISGAFTGVVSVFYANNTATIILQALIFAAAASLVAAAVYVIVRLIKSAVARLRGGVGAAGAKGDRNKKVKRFFFRKRR